MSGTKITLDAAMRARDVSRPRGDREAEARTGEPAAGYAPRNPATAAATAGPAGADPGPAARRPAAGQGEEPKTQRSHRRRRHR